MPYNPETEQFFQAPATIVDSTPDGDTVQEGFDDRLTPAMAGVYTDLNLLKENGMIGVGIPATTTSRGIARVATLADMEPDAVIENGPAVIDATGGVITPTPTANAVPQADENGKIDPRWYGTASRLFASFNTSEPDGLLANGGSYSRTTYARLFAVIGTAFGAGDGSTTFNVPDFRGRTLQGANANLMAVLAAGLPNITGTFDGFPYSIGGAFYSGAETMQFGGNGSQHKVIYFDASRANTIYGASNTVQPPAIAANIFIKF